MYVGQLMLWYKFGLDYVLYELPMAQGYALRAVAMENDGWLQFAGVKKASEGFIRQEVLRRINN